MEVVFREDITHNLQIWIELFLSRFGRCESSKHGIGSIVAEKSNKIYLMPFPMTRQRKQQQQVATSILVGALSWLTLILVCLGSITLTVTVVWTALFGKEGWWSWWCRGMAVIYGAWFWWDKDRPYDGSVKRTPIIVRFMEPILENARRYFAPTIIVEGTGCEADPMAGHQTAVSGNVAKPVMLCCHPHGIWGMGVLTNLGFPSADHGLGPIYVLTLDLHFCIPIWREICLGLGFASVSRRSLTALLNRGKNVAVVLGGAREALDSRPGVMELTLRRRRGFFRTALEWGVPIRAVLTWGEVDLYHQVRFGWLRRIQDFCLRYVSFSMPCFWGRYWWVPGPRPLATVISGEISTRGGECDEDHAPDSTGALTRITPTAEQIDELQERYISVLRTIHEKYNDLLGPTALIIK